MHRVDVEVEWTLLTERWRTVENVTLVTAFVAGIISFISPCVLPIVPGYISFVSGVSLQELKDQAEIKGEERKRLRRQVAANSVLFVLGFSLVFVAMGASATYIGNWFAANRTVLARVAGVIIIIFGLHTMGLTPIKWLNYEKRFQARSKPLGFAGSFLIGLAFAFGWSPCIGPILAGVLALAATQETVQQGVTLLAVYSLGLGVPFIATGLAINRFLDVFSRVKKRMRLVELAAGVLLIAVGVLVATDQLQALSRYFTFLPVLG
jgi:cytochrome c-type biogenesis protein